MRQRTLFFYQIQLDLCLADLNAYLTGTQRFKTHIELFEQDVKKVGDQYEYKGHHLQSSTMNFASLKSKFVNSLIANLKARYKLIKK